MKTISRRSINIGLATAAVFACMSTMVQAQDRFPNKPIRMIVPFAAGGGNDAVARIVGESISQILGQPVIVENKPGAGGNIGTDFVAKAPANGYTLVHVANTVVVNPYLYRKLPFDVQKDLTPVGLLATAPLLVLANPRSSVTSLTGLAQQMKEHKPLSYASPGTGTPHHFAMELLSSRLGSDIVHVPYKGAGPAVTDVVGGQLPILVSTPQSVTDFVATGRLRLLATMEASRPPEFKDVPTVSEMVPNFNVSIWHGLMVPARTPQPIIDSLSTAVSKSLADPEVLKKLAGVGFTGKFGNAAEMKKRISTELDIWKSVAEKAKIVPE
ncbi:MAG: tripartite tricarboxylate transporter substrate binding protein [Pseudomonadota bacterium]